VGGDWTRYYEATGTEPRPTLLDALQRFDEEEPRERFAVDLGCGTGRDTVELLRRGWSVLALDSADEAIERLLAQDDLSEDDRRRLDVHLSRFENAEWPAADLVNSSFALPFCRPGDFPALWERIRHSLRPGGRFSGHLFGDRDGWSGEDDMTFHSRAEVDALLARFEVELLDEVEEDGQTAVGDEKHWHLFHVVVRRT
jgi:SAM-dependent methyltransferase